MDWRISGKRLVTTYGLMAKLDQTDWRRQTLALPKSEAATLTQTFENLSFALFIELIREQGVWIPKYNNTIEALSKEKAVTSEMFSNPLKASSNGLETCVSTVAGEAPGYVVVTVKIGGEKSGNNS